MRSSNRLFFGDNLGILRRYLEDDSVSLIYLDPPFNSDTAYHAPGSRQGFADRWRWDAAAQAAYGATVEAGGRLSEAMQAFRLLLGEDSVLAYLAMMAPRLKELHRALKPTGSIYLHCDPRASHHLKLLMDAIFGRENYRNEVIWCYGGRGAKARARQFPRNHDVILVYSKRSGRQTYNRQHTQRALAPAEARARGLRQDTFGRWFKTSPRGDYTDDSIRRLEADGRIHRTKTGAARVKYFLPAKGGLVVEELLVGDTWLDIPDAMHIGKERVGYPTQKPRALLERIVKTSSNEGEVVLDPFCGSGTTIVAAEALGRRWIGIDNASLAIELTQRRLREAFGETVEQGDDYEVVEESHSDRGSAA